jgi:hypothetical protein
MNFTLMARKARGWRESEILAESILATVRFHVGVHLFAIQNDMISIRNEEEILNRILLIVPLALYWLVLALFLALPRAVVEPIVMTSHLLI